MAVKGDTMQYVKGDEIRGNSVTYGVVTAQWKCPLSSIYIFSMKSVRIFVWR